MKSLAIVLLYIWASVAGAQQENASAAANPNKVKSFQLEAGKPVEITFNDGRVLGMKIYEIFFPLQSSLTLSENSCTRELGQKMEFVIPLITRSLIPYWKVHPTKAGHPVTFYDSDSARDEADSSTAFFARTNEDNFDQRLASLRPDQIQEKSIHSYALQTPTAMGWLDCAEECPASLLPNNRIVQFWDENFESGNNAVTMVRRNDDGPSLNQMISRMEEISLNVGQGKIHFGLPMHKSGSTMFFPPGITYQIQWYIADKNLVDENDGLCEMLWDMDFSRVFTSFTNAVELVSDVDKVIQAHYPEYVFDERDRKNPFLEYMFRPDVWEDSEYHK